MLTVKVYNTSDVDQGLSGVVEVPARGCTEIPFEAAVPYRDRKIEGLYFDFDGLDGAYRYKTDGRITHLAYDSWLDPFEGYGQCGVQFVRAAVRRGLTLSFPVPVPEPDVPLVREVLPDVWEAVNRPAHPCLWGIEHGLPDFLPRLLDRGVPNVVLHTMFEATTIPAKWVPHCNRSAGLVVPATEQVAIFRRSGVTVPIHVVGDPIDVETFAYRPKKGRNEVFTFFCWGRLAPRKMPLELIDCFRRAFGDREDVRLVVKTHSGWLGPRNPELRDGFRPYPNVVVHNDKWPVERLVEQVHAADCCVFLSHGEGCGNPQLQAMAAGTPVITPNYTGMKDYALPQIVWPIDSVGMEPAPHSMYETTGDWWLPDLDQTVDTMRYVEANYMEALKKTKPARKFVEKNHAPDAHLSGVLKAVEAIEAGQSL